MLHWRVYREEIVGDTEWIPSLCFWKATVPFYPREISLYWLKWGVSFRWWFR
jgi:hypothetical protein